MTKKPSSRVIVALIASVLLILLLNTCGIEQFIQLNQPSTPQKVGPTITFRKTTNNSEQEFIGFDLYYRFYDAGQNPFSDLSDIIEFEDLGTNGFRRLHARSDNQNTGPPLVRIQPNDRTPGGSPPDNDEFTLTIDFTGLQSTLKLEDPFPQIFDDGTSGLIDAIDGDVALDTYPPPPILIKITDIRRDVYDGFDYKSFSEFSDDDSDLTSEMKTTVNNGQPLQNIQIVLYVVSYGLDVFGGTFKPLHSEPLLLGIIQRDLP